MTTTNRPIKPVDEARIQAAINCYWASDAQRAQNKFVKMVDETTSAGYYVRKPLVQLADAGDSPIGVAYHSILQVTVLGDATYDRALSKDRGVKVAQKGGPVMMFNADTSAIATGAAITNANGGDIKNVGAGTKRGTALEYIPMSDWGMVFIDI